MSSLFQPLKTVVLSPSAGSVTAAIPKNHETARIYAGGSSDIFIRFSTTNGAGDVATSADMILPNLYLEYYDVGSYDTISVYSAGSATVNVTTGADGN
jgi:hypothetical protein